MNFLVFYFLISLFVFTLFVKQIDLFRLPNSFKNSTNEVYHLGIIVGGQIGNYRSFPYMVKLHDEYGILD